MGKLREALADLAHRQWTGWMDYLFDISTMNDDDTCTIPAWAVKRWLRQMGTKYEDLPENEQESDLQEADRVLNILHEHNVHTWVEWREKCPD